ncbi:MAG TPA: ribonuclease R [Paracoccaceae bacterium]|nr:ribonuclease R [Paracoccaceae bacterium]
MDQLPDKAALRQWIAENPGQTTKRDIARAFGIRGGPAKIELKRLLAELEDEGTVTRRRRKERDAGRLPPVAVLRVTGPDAQGDLFAEAAEGDAPARILIVAGKGDPALAAGDRILARLSEVAGEGHSHEARLIRRIGAAAPRVLGVFRRGAEGGRIIPVTKGEAREWRVPAGADLGARDGELGEGESDGPPRRLGLPAARIVARLGDPGAPKSVSLIAIHEHAIPDRFPDSVLAEAETVAAHPAAGPREDLRDLPLVTIDPADARDRDDAVFAAPDTDIANPGGHIVWVAIADVAAYVRPGSALDREARKRGNSTYFPDRVVPMLPDRLSGDVCSLHQDVDRACLAVRLRIDAGGSLTGFRFARGIMRSRASLEYGQVQSALDGLPDAVTAPLLDPVLRPLLAAYRCAARARDLRQPLNLDLPERRIELAEDGRVLSVAFKDRLETHRLIEEFMVMANVAAARELQRLRKPLLYRVHEEPSPEKLDALREVAQASGFTLAKGQVLKTAHLNRLLDQAAGTDQGELINISTLRSLPQAYYLPTNLGHFGLALRDYAHFTSPIRRYADLIVHRALIAAHGWGEDGLSAGDVERLEETAKLISDAERRSMAAERDTTDRYLAAWLSDRVGSTFTGRVSGVQRFGLFVKLDESGADGLVPIREVGREFFHFDAAAQTLIGADTGTVIGLGARVTVRLAEAVPVTGGLMLELLELEARALPRGARGRGPGRPGGKPAPRRTVRRARR